MKSSHKPPPWNKRLTVFEHHEFTIPQIIVFENKSFLNESKVHHGGEFQPSGRGALSILAGNRRVEATSTHKLAVRLFETQKGDLSRSPLDIARVMEMLAHRGVRFVSVRRRLNTPNAKGGGP